MIVVLYNLPSSQVNVMLSQSKVLFCLKNHLYIMIGKVENYRLGRVLTIIDASISDQEQRKALKDLMREAFHSKEYYTSELGVVIEQFCKRLGIQPFQEKMTRDRFFGNDPSTVSEDYFPLESLQEEVEDSAKSMCSCFECMKPEVEEIEVSRPTTVSEKEEA